MYLLTLYFINGYWHYLIFPKTESYHLYIHKVKFYPSGNNFTQALLVMLVTNMISAIVKHLPFIAIYKAGSQHLNISKH